MSNEMTTEKTTYGDAELTYLVNFKSNPSRQEECHGFHTFNEDEEISRELISIKLFFGSNVEIDLTDKLSKEQIDKILNSLE